VMGTRSNRRLTLLGFGVIAALLMSACGGTSPSGTANPSGGSGKTLVKAISGDTQTIDPRLNFQPRATEMVANMYDQLTTYETVKGEGGQLVADPKKPTGLLAESWDVSPDGLEWTWHLRKGVKFHSGRVMTADDVLWSLQRAAKIQKGGWFDHEVIGLYAANNENDIDTAVTVVDPNTLKMKFLRRTPYVAQVLAGPGMAIYDSKLMKEHATDSDPWAAEYLKDHDVGTGPFMLDKIEPGVQLVMKRFDDYFLGRAKIGQIIFKVVASPADRAVLLKNGEVQFAEELDLNTAKQLSSSAAVQILDFKTTDQLFLMMNTTSGPTADPKVRQAISWAVPYDEIVKTIYFGYAQPGGGPVPIGMPGYDSAAPFYHTDVDKAKATLAASSQPNGFSIELSYDASRPAWEQAATLIQSSLAPLNIKVTLNKLAAANFNDQFVAKKLPFFMFQALSWVNEPTYHFLLFWETGSYSNRINYANPQVDQLLAQGKTSTDEAVRTKAYADVQKLMLEDAPAAWIGQPDLIIAAGKNVTGYIARPDQITRFYSIDF
jgi:peptide/nickel transport system substrate-binding protein